jgi:hypothetical protein
MLQRQEPNVKLKKNPMISPISVTTTSNSWRYLRFFFWKLYNILLFFVRTVNRNITQTQWNEGCWQNIN